MFSLDEADEILKQRINAANEIKRLRSIVIACDEVIAAVLDRSNEDEFENWVREVRGEEVEPGKRKIKWQYGGDTYVIYRRSASKPRRTIDAGKLLEHNIPAHVIQACTVEGQPGKAGVGIRKLGSDDEED